MVFRLETIPGTTQSDFSSHPSLHGWLSRDGCALSERSFKLKRVKLTRVEKDAQIRREARATLILFAVCFVWNVGFAYCLSGTGIRIGGLPLWWLISTPGMFVIAVAGVVYLLKKVFVNFDLDTAAATDSTVISSGTGCAEKSGGRSENLKGGGRDA